MEEAQPKNCPLHAALVTLLEVLRSQSWPRVCVWQASLMDAWGANAPAPAPEPPQQLADDLRRQLEAGLGPRLELQLGPQELQACVWLSRLAPSCPSRCDQLMWHMSRRKCGTMCRRARAKPQRWWHNI